MSDSNEMEKISETDDAEYYKKEKSGSTSPGSVPFLALPLIATEKLGTILGIALGANLLFCIPLLILSAFWTYSADFLLSLINLAHYAPEPGFIDAGNPAHFFPLNLGWMILGGWFVLTDKDENETEEKEEKEELFFLWMFAYLLVFSFAPFYTSQVMDSLFDVLWLSPWTWLLANLINLVITATGAYLLVRGMLALEE